jgi:hypothetical protein
MSQVEDVPINELKGNKEEEGEPVPKNMKEFLKPSNTF